MIQCKSFLSMCSSKLLIIQARLSSDKSYLHHRGIGMAAIPKIYILSNLANFELTFECLVDNSLVSRGWILVLKFGVRRELGVSLVLGIWNFWVNLKPHLLLMAAWLQILGLKFHPLAISKFLMVTLNSSLLWGFLGFLLCLFI